MQKQPIYLIPGHYLLTPGMHSVAGWDEVAVTGPVAGATFASITKGAQIPIILDGAGTYTERMQRADAAGAKVALHVHVNSLPNGQDYGLCLHFPMSAAGKSYAEKLAHELSAVWRWPFRAVAATEYGYPGAYRVTRIGNTPSVVVEIGNGNGALGKTLPDMATTIGAALGLAIVAIET